MSLKSIRESYSKLLTTFTDAGVKLNESQKADLDTFVLALESTMSKQRETVIRKTKKAVTEKLESEYKQLFESILDNMSKNTELAAKIQQKKTQINESKKIASKVNDYLDLYVESVLPKKTLVDYDRMQKLEKIHESLQNMLLVNEDTVESKIQQLEESYKHQKSKLETEVAKMQVKLNESMNKTQEYKRKVDQFKAVELLESKTKDLPSYEARQIKKRLAEATVPEIEAKFEKVLEAVCSETAKKEKEQEPALESEIRNILEKDEEISEDDYIKGHARNLNKDDLIDGRVHNKHLSEDDEEFETTETVTFDECGDVELDESEVVDQNLMKWYCSLV